MFWELMKLKKGHQEWTWEPTSVTKATTPGQHLAEEVAQAFLVSIEYISLFNHCLLLEL